MADDKKQVPEKIPEKIKGFAHIIAAATYSIFGLKRLFQETAFRHQCLAYCLVLILLFFMDGSFHQYLISFALFMILIAVEAINTAIEIIVDRISPEWSEMARDAKDLGSFAAMAIMFAYAAFLVSVVFGG